MSHALGRAPWKQGFLLFILVAPLAAMFSACGDSGSLVLGATTSVQDTGLLDALVRSFHDKTGYDVKPIVGGSGQVLELARKGEVDVVLTHAPEDEARFMTDGEGVDRRPVMQNLFLVAGPPADPAGVAGAGTLGEAFRRIAAKQQAFISRGDNSGTHQRELAVWKTVGVDPRGQAWYQESAVGQGQNLLVASDKGAYALVDSSTFATFKKRAALAAYVTDSQQPNVYSVISVNPEKHSNVNSGAAKAFSDFVTSAEGQQLIGRFGVDQYGEALFEPIAGQ
jgi:tungstate transport system substrate-binding protein